MATILQMTFSKVFSWMKSLYFHSNLKFVPKGPIDDKATLVWIIAWHHQEASHYQNQWWSKSVALFFFIRLQWISASIGPWRHLVTSYDVLELGQHWFRLWHGACWHQAITWTNVDLPSVGSGGMQLEAISYKMFKTSIAEKYLKMTYFITPVHQLWSYWSKALGHRCGVCCEPFEKKRKHQISQFCTESWTILKTLGLRQTL